MADLLPRPLSSSHQAHTAPPAAAFAFLCDELARSLARTAVGGCLLHDLSAMLAEVFEGTFIVDLEEGAVAGPTARVQLGGSQLAAALWWNLDGRQAEVALDLLAPLAGEVAPGPTRASPLVSLFATFRLLAELMLASQGHLEGIDAMLGCPLSLFPQVSCG